MVLEAWGTVMGAAAVPDGLHAGLVLTSFGFGLRHGVDWDHIAAIADLTSAEDRPRRSLRLATTYALGHALVVFVLGLAAIAFAERLPDGVDAVMERFVGATLLLMGGYVIYGLVRFGRDFRLRSRWMLVADGLARIGRRRGRTAAPALVPAGAVERRPDDATRASDRPHGHVHPTMASADLDDGASAPSARKLSSALIIGMVHGIGAETPTQVVVFVAAAGVAGRGAGLLLLVAFIAGLLLSNTGIAAAAIVGLLNAQRFRTYATVSVIIATFSIIVGAVFLLGRGDVLPGILT